VPPVDVLSPGGRDGYSIAHTALSFRGVPYRLGGADPSSGFDCSGLVHYVFALHGLSLPRVVRDQYRVGRPVDLDRLEPGDLIFFETEGDDVSHVGIAIGGDQFVHAPNSRGHVRTSRVTEGYWGERVVGARRVGTIDGS
jgi:cell wall-associated NlpC family hydrolase